MRSQEALAAACPSASWLKNDKRQAARNPSSVTAFASAKISLGPMTVLGVRNVRVPAKMSFRTRLEAVRATCCAAPPPMEKPRRSI